MAPIKRKHTTTSKRPYKRHGLTGRSNRSTISLNRSHPSQIFKRKPSQRFTLVTAKAGRVSSRVGAKAASYAKKSRKVLKKKRSLPKVSSKFRNKVAAAISGQSYNGRYETQFHYTLNESVVNSVHWFVGMAVASNKFTTASPNEIIDAISVLWNQKVAVPNWNVTTGNLYLQAAKVQIKNITTDYEVTNNTQRQQHIEVYECMPVTNTSDDIMADWNTILSNEDMPTALLPGPNVGRESVTTVATNVYSTNQGPRPEYQRNLRKTWKWKKSKFILEGGEKMTYKVSTGAFIFDPLKILDGDDTLAGQMPYFAKGITRLCVFRCVPEITFANDGHAGMDTDVGAIATSPFHLQVVVTKRFFLQMPQSVQGLDPAAAGGPVIASNRHDAYKFQYSYDLTARDPGGMIDNDDEDNVIGTDPAVGAPL